MKKFRRVIIVFFVLSLFSYSKFKNEKEIAFNLLLFPGLNYSLNSMDGSPLKSGKSTKNYWNHAVINYINIKKNLIKINHKFNDKFRIYALQQGGFYAPFSVIAIDNNEIIYLLGGFKRDFFNLLLTNNKILNRSNYYDLAELVIKLSILGESNVEIQKKSFKVVNENSNTFVYLTLYDKHIKNSRVYEFKVTENEFKLLKIRD